MTTKAVAETLIAGMRHVGGETGDIQRAQSMLDSGDFDGVQALYSELEDDMWEQTRKDKMRGH